MSARTSFWARRRSRVFHEFWEDSQGSFDGPIVRLLSRCERHEFTLDSRGVFRYRPWTGEDFPPDSRMCKKCLADRGGADAR
jgi:hypothetical protein